MGRKFTTNEKNLENVLDEIQTVFAGLDESQRERFCKQLKFYTQFLNEKKNCYESIVVENFSNRNGKINKILSTKKRAFRLSFYIPVPGSFVPLPVPRSKLSLLTFVSLLVLFANFHLDFYIASTYWIINAHSCARSIINFEPPGSFMYLFISLSLFSYTPVPGQKLFSNPY